MLSLALGCGGQKQGGEPVQGSKEQVQNAEKGSDAASEQQWVTTSVSVSLNRPDGSSRWVRVTPDAPARLAKGEWAEIEGKKCVGRAGGITMIRIEANRLTSSNCR
jgi:hypothetical protein